MKGLGFLVLAYALTAAAIGAYLLALGRKRRSLERRLGQLGGRTPDRPAQGAARD